MVKRPLAALLQHWLAVVWQTVALQGVKMWL
jgi:hypothetical protein